MANHSHPTTLTNNIHHPNFPPHSENDFEDSEVFGLTSQKSAIQNYGIAGRVWRVSSLKLLGFNLVRRPGEAAYTPTTCLESKDPGIQFDPLSPFSAGQRHRPLSTLKPKSHDPNLKHKENGGSTSSEHAPPVDLDVGKCSETRHNS